MNKKLSTQIMSISVFIFLLLVGVISFNNVINEQREEIETFEKILESEREVYAVREEELMRDIARYRNKNNDLEQTNEILTSYIRLKNQELEMLK